MYEVTLKSDPRPNVLPYYDFCDCSYVCIRTIFSRSFLNMKDAKKFFLAFVKKNDMLWWHDENGYRQAAGNAKVLSCNF